ncbi:uncharacterized protein LOC121880491 [Homarus americanus]|uniref:uncharacterized protein LOC121880491 n=1 Tax=Homarus americanus TaxID=6706 RepID=UPI001C497BA0|nr:uncharacterized protein LOC121880491 [Homarus americanus]
MATLQQQRVMVVMMAMMVGASMAIPSHVANRMIPSWWINARTKGTCSSWSDCGPQECCVRPMLATNNYCLPYNTLGQTCVASALMVDVEREIYLDNCPCVSHLTCANLHSHSVCIDPDSFDRLLLRPSPQPIQL